MSARPSLTVRVCARAGLLGNPSDVYGGKAIALSVCDFAAEVWIAESDELRFEADPEGARLLAAALGRFPEARDRRLRLGFRSDIPRQVGLAGSSAIVVGALRALGAWFGVELHPAEVAERALAAEAEDLGIVAGPMDRVIQAYGGLVHMDLRAPRGAHSYRRLDPGLLPPLFVAWDPHPGEPSGVAHADVRARFTHVLVDEGLVCLERRDVAGLMRLVDRNFDTRASIWKLRERDVAMVRLGRALGAAVKFCGSGGAVLGVMRDEAEFPALARAYAEAGFPCIRPTVAG